MTEDALMRIERVVPRDETFKRLEMYIQGYTMSWAADDRQIISTSDGVNILGPPKEAFHTRVYGLRGDPENARFEDLPSFPHMPMRVIEGELDVPASYWGESCLAVGNCIYQFTMTTNHPYIKTDGSFWPDFRPAGSKLIYSPDNGVTWHNQDGSQPTIWEDWDKCSRKTWRSSTSSRSERLPRPNSCKWARRTKPTRTDTRMCTARAVMSPATLINS